jgi:hypothetical protein
MSAVERSEDQQRRSLESDRQARAHTSLFWWVAIPGVFLFTDMTRDELVLLALWQAALAGIAGGAVAGVVATAMANFTGILGWFRSEPGASRPKLWWAWGIFHLLTMILLLLLPSVAVGRLVSLAAVPMIAGQYPSVGAVLNGLR